MSSSAASFAPYQPPPDEHPGRTKVNLSAPPPISQAPARNSSDQQGEYYQDDDDDPRYATESYQSGTASYSQHHQQHQQQYHHQQRYQDDPSYSAGATAASPFQPAYEQQQRYRGGQGGVQPDHASWATSQGVSISTLCFAAWALPPFSSVAVLIMETTNDLARFHAYQSGLCGVIAIISLYILRHWFGWYTLSIICGMGALGASWVAGSNAHRAAPTLEKTPYLPRLGPLAEEWVGAE
ncbi:hypothetical protein BCV69DRAFT_282212 [Microstroma glucosiphilum]|uniref:Uncharacterized protein n=1 Tax=Pseudomicrostroma glucosiphilum TaxID=1684307 RepID=A0A316U8B7_9BASI|nr:hypothetical protein BCV69DRAFT_282212 [Pseudomicrostroma glucosiphilum]PWN21490.1 hypothetical protein BCV69DRAFT_282212 [Pseudomicrostroma glucosiphilum]